MELSLSLDLSKVEVMIAIQSLYSKGFINFSITGKTSEFFISDEGRKYIEEHTDIERRKLTEAEMIFSKKQYFEKIHEIFEDANRVKDEIH